MNLCNSTVGDTVGFLTVYTFKFIYVMFVLLITIGISKMHVDFFAIKIHYGMVHALEKTKEILT